MMKKKIFILALTVGITAFSPALSQVSYGLENSRHHPIYAKNGMVASQEYHATQVGVDILKQGGNAIDAAVAVGFTLAVTHPQAGNIGGGGFMLIRLKDGTTTSIDFREIAPQKAFRDMFLHENGEADLDRSVRTHLASGVPGTVKGLLYALEKYGTQKRNTILDPAIKLADEGFIVGRGLSESFRIYGDNMMKNHPQSQAIFYKEGRPISYGNQLIQKDLAQSLTLIRDQGESAFYKGDIARKIVEEMKANKGLITLEDLQNYKIIERPVVKGTYKGYEIYSMAPPSSGGIHIIQILNILENYDLKQYGHNSANTIHLMSEAMKRAYADRSEYLGDPDFVKVPVNALIDKTYAKNIANTITLDKVTPASAIKPGDLAPYESDQTTHFSVVDKEGNAVAVTYTLNTTFGTGIVAKGTGIILNNQMDDFSVKPGTPNTYGLVGGDANAIEPNKRPLSSMSPTIVTKNDRVVLVTGSPGGSRIITTVLQIILNTLEHDMNVAEASSAPRIHHQWLPDYIRIEEGVSPDTIARLKEKGHEVKVEPVMGSTQSIMIDEEGFYGASDPRSADDLSAGY